jgi:hypothetical protein
MALIAGGSVISAVIAAAGYAWVDLNRFWQHSYNEVEAVGNVVSDQVGPAITLGDRKAASEILASLRSDSLIHDVFLYDASGTCFANYRRSGMIYGEYAGCKAESPRSERGLQQTRGIRACDGRRPASTRTIGSDFESNDGVRPKTSTAITDSLISPSRPSSLRSTTKRRKLLARPASAKAALARIRSS